MEKAPDDDSGISTESCECKNGHISEEIGNETDAEKKLAVKSGLLLSKISAKLPACKVKVVHILLVVVAVVWGLLMLPIIFYHLPVEDEVRSLEL